jgi:short-subunit dehydrogenase
MELAGKRVWITGASSGIGEALISQFLTAGCAVALTARREEQLTALATPYLQAGKKVLVLAGDVTDGVRMHEIVREIEKAWGGLDIAIFNAGWYKPVSPKKWDLSIFQKSMDVNYYGVLHGIDAVLPLMMAQKKGWLAMVSSVAGYRGLPRASAYCASKSALIALSFDLRPFGIGVSVINPGFIATPMTASNTFYMPFLRSPEYAARKILKGLKKEKDEIHFPLPFTLLMKLLRILPFKLYKLLFSLGMR